IRSAVSQAMQRRLASSQINSSTEKIRRLLDELQEQRAEEQIAKTRGDLYNQIFHDMNGSLTIISGFAQMVNERLNKNPDLRIELKDLEFIKDRMRIIARQTVSCIEITRRYRESIRYQPNESAPSVSINQLLKDLDQLVRLHPSLMENELVITPPVENVAAKIHGTYLIQILRNLAINALQCTPLPHRVEIGGETLREPLDLTKFKDNSNERLLYVETLENTAPLLKLWVRDNGPGIPPEVLPKIFQAYFTTKGPREGTGLGLNIVQRFIKEGNGALHCRTKSGEGTTFTIYLPGVELAKQT
ncbi:MAG TPA: HAMP domain-containing sensor histidine kinase, partial [Verrucomicrobiae bacterium]|nr:HAMP domain-containing sensor histidine kinase [Verrucomicrobiae bacterium]